MRHLDVGQHQIKPFALGAVEFLDQLGTVLRDLASRAKVFDDLDDNLAGDRVVIRQKHIATFKFLHDSLHSLKNRACILPQIRETGLASRKVSPKTYRLCA